MSSLSSEHQQNRQTYNMLKSEILNSLILLAQQFQSENLSIEEINNSVNQFILLVNKTIMTTEDKHEQNTLLELKQQVESNYEYLLETYEQAVQDELDDTLISNEIQNGVDNNSFANVKSDFERRIQNLADQINQGALVLDDVIDQSEFMNKLLDEAIQQTNDKEIQLEFIVMLEKLNSIVDKYLESHKKVEEEEPIKVPSENAGIDELHQSTNAAIKTPTEQLIATDDKNEREAIAKQIDQINSSFNNYLSVVDKDLDSVTKEESKNSTAAEETEPVSSEMASIVSRDIDLGENIGNETEEEDEEIKVVGVSSNKKEETKQIEEKRIQEQKMVEETRKAEENKKIEEEKRAAETKRIEDQKRLDEEKKIQEQKKKLEEAKRIEEQKKIEEAKKKLEEKKAAELKKAEEQKRAEEEKKKLEEERKAEEKRKIEEAKRIEEQKQIEEAKKAEEQNKVEEIKKEEQKKSKNEAEVAKSENKITKEEESKSSNMAALIVAGVAIAGLVAAGIIIYRKMK
ncbi:hypothetical protein TVAG_506640 [Trichomonas vaginalis G3]|uniref:Uncharacterized protein n=1 Tax=Trichomonas vaginalis (strain ATCC PRA-98 / G3) TaxID=412133 RepID=A2GBV8_TRIV3|nr:hypothetical protein TVAGG3_0792310 [Trichomonas vaginalis G3]EAX85357.1 hypothetical protein TVAG_506640 [Trichomonas vaginalis G3]KAI5495888.1 hypothetical protein TVAGG3_0792310 [Trichomonas vaginalis G3]|eukprot:XP_001298287.1 hypothetical protein [Trichomonas vaginalis G3]